MSIRTSVAGNSIRAGALPSALFPLTLTGKFTIQADRGAVDQPLIVAGPLAQVDLIWNDHANSNDGKMALVSYNGSAFTDAVFASRPAVGRPFFAYITIAGTGNGQFNAGWGYCDDASPMVTVSSTLGALTVTPTSIQYGNDAFSNWSNYNYGYLTCMPSVLTFNELLWERFAALPVRPGKSNFVYFVPAEGPTLAIALKDYSGNGNDAVATGTPTIDPNVPVDDIFFFHLSGTDTTPGNVPPPPSGATYPRFANFVNNVPSGTIYQSDAINYARHLTVGILSDNYEGAAADNGYNRGTVVDAMLVGNGFTVPYIVQYQLDFYDDSRNHNGAPTWAAQLAAMANKWYLYRPDLNYLCPGDAHCDASNHFHASTPDGPPYTWQTNAVDLDSSWEDANGNNLEAAFAKYADGYYVTGSTADAAPHLSGHWHDDIGGINNATYGNYLGPGPTSGTVYPGDDVTAMGHYWPGQAKFATWLHTNTARLAMCNMNLLTQLSSGGSYLYGGKPLWQLADGDFATVMAGLINVFDAAMCENAWGYNSSTGQSSLERDAGFEASRMCLQRIDNMVKKPELNQYTEYGIDNNGNDGAVSGTVGQGTRYAICASLVVGKGCHAPLNASVQPAIFDYYSVDHTTFTSLSFSASTSAQFGAGCRWLGTAIDDVQTGPMYGKCYARKFLTPSGRTAIVLLNPSASHNPSAAPETVDLFAINGKSWQKIKASAFSTGGNVGSNTTVDSGAIVNSVTVPVGDGIILVSLP